MTNSHFVILWAITSIDSTYKRILNSNKTTCHNFSKISTHNVRYVVCVFISDLANDMN